MARLQCFSDDVRSPSAPTTPRDPFLLFFALLNKLFTFNQLCQLIFMISSHLNLFRPITELVRPFSFPLSVTSSILSLLAKLWNPLVGPISSLVGNLDSRTSPSPMRHRVLILVRVEAQHDISRPILNASCTTCSPVAGPNFLPCVGSCVPYKFSHNPSLYIASLLPT
jgi:hypothetical protein